MYVCDICICMCFVCVCVFVTFTGSCGGSLGFGGYTCGDVVGRGCLSKWSAEAIRWLNSCLDLLYY